MRSARSKKIALCFAAAAAVSVCGTALVDWSDDSVRSAGAVQSEVVRFRGHASSPAVSKAFRGDSNLAGSDIAAAADAAAADFNRETCGIANVTIAWDLDMEREFRCAALTDDNLLIGMTSEDAAVALGYDESRELLGMTRSRGRRTDVAWVFLVTDKIEGEPALAEWTALHEIGHAFGMAHVSAGAMQPRAPFIFGGARAEWDDSDRDEFCRVVGCDPHVLRDCPKP